MSTEYFDVVDASGKPTGKTKPRTQVHADGDWHRAVEVWIVNSKNEVLIQRRAKNKDSFPGKWDASCAGHISAGDDSPGTAIRELKEELGIEAAKHDLQYLFAARESHVTNRKTFLDNEIKDIYLLHMDIGAEELILQKEEVIAVEFIHFLDLKKMLKKSPGKFVPHNKTYQRLFDFLQKFQDVF